MDMVLKMQKKETDEVTMEIREQLKNAIREKAIGVED